ncbi:MAG: hypothetical protein CMJ18_15645 [Phycisphaeraceae bacterium]|nr:hypothetical protein [Phycisphaeraceae bacterium]
MPSARRPDIFLFMPDQMHRETVGPGGLCRTPNFDALASRGTAFSRAFTPTPICTPARASTFTGMLPHQHRLLHNAHMTYPKQRTLPAGLTTFADELRAAGYATFYTGKWHVGTDEPTDHGFDRVETASASATCDDRLVSERVLVPNRCPDKNVLAATTAQDRDDTEPWQVCRSTADFIRCHHQSEPDRPFLAFASTSAPHVPWFTPASYVSTYDAGALQPWPNYGDDLADKPESWRKHYNGYDYCRLAGNWPRAAHALTHYYGMITLIDEAFGLVVEALETTSRLDNTLIVVASDHGELMGRHGLFGKNEMLSEDLIRIPLTVSWPAQLGGGRSLDAIVTLCDLFPTLLDAAGAGGSGTDARAGRSLLPLMKDGQASVWPDEVYLQHHGDLQYNLVRAVRGRRFKYVYWANDRDELYDLHLDPWEQRNLAADARYVDLLDAQRERLLHHMTETDDPFLRGVRANLQNRPIRS